MKGLRAILVPAMTILGVLIGSDALVAKEAGRSADSGAAPAHQQGSF